MPSNKVHSLFGLKFGDVTSGVQNARISPVQRILQQVFLLPKARSRCLFFTHCVWPNGHAWLPMQLLRTTFHGDTASDRAVLLTFALLFVVLFYHR
jgi:hypothetical protein